MTTPQPLEGDAFYLSDVSPTDKPWDVHRALAEEVGRLYELTDCKHYSNRIADCSNQLGFALRANDEGEIKLKLQDARFCRVRHCPVCQWRRSLMWRAKFFQVLPKVSEAYPTGQWLFLTLTVKTCPLEDLRDTLTWMNTAWKRLVQRKDFPALGFVKSVEVTRSHDGMAHPHFHCLLMVPAGYFKRGYLSQARWTELWKECLRADYTPIVNIKRVKDKGKPSKSLPTPSENGQVGEIDKGLLKAICETLKYSVKPDDLVADPEWLSELTKQLHKTRAIAVGGVLKEYLSEEEPEDLINGGIEDEEVSEDDPKLIFDWGHIVRRYRKR
jgi:plasmid rolling circle replication initiator protein Rep